MDAPSLPRGLFAQALGARWHLLGKVLLHLHQPGGIVATGAFRVRRGNSLARLLAWLARLPRETAAADMQLHVTPVQQGEEWRRSFDGRHLLTTQRLHAECVVGERAGIGEIYLRLEVTEGALHYRSTGAAVCLGRLRIPLPGWLAPRVTASETPAGDQIEVRVEIRLPVIGLLIAYEGTIAIEAGT